ncbi:hypothetical protein BZB76_2158 [Actinomadura pelletieri DSM 43383]|uniref:Uncharacterized protein n=1 Tax=Actinomadura pelletieri DSM 43383 TaxID=1120940 RepID=A0A495QTE7_9ACTN|nr:hypothetical protein [Actinomadura pelletieri]RKS76796.1 hypothetical protein BZB76_2158 [Actinomadura pelletieri DSM 43383]
MQLPRVVIAAVFIVIGALIAVPALVSWMSPDSEPAASATTSPSASASTSDPSASPSGGSSARPVTATIGAVSCPASTVRVTIRNTGSKTEDFGIEKNDDTAAIPGQIRPDATRTVAVDVREDRRTRITVNWAGKRLTAKTVKANCEKAEAAPAPTKTPPDELPNTGPDAVLWARAATGVGVILTGVIIFWYGGIWPRRREQIFPKKNS